MHRAELYRSRDGWRYRVRSGSEVIDGSEAYYSKWNARRGLRKNHPEISKADTVVVVDL